MRMPERVRFIAAAGACIVLLAGCSKTTNTASGSSPTPTAASTARSTAAQGSGPVDVLYAGSLVELMENQIKPPFDVATGYKFTGLPGGSDGLAKQITGKVTQGDVFISASPKVNDALEGAANGNWVSWYATFASSALVLGYNPKSRFASDLKSKPWYEVVTQPGFLLGRTDPAVDPKGKLAAEAVSQTATAQNLPALNQVLSSTSNVFPEETLVGRLQAGQLDAGFFYSSEAKAANIPTVPLTGVDLKATYTITVLNHAPHEQGAEAFVKYLLGPTGTGFLTNDGFTVVTPPAVTGTGVPSSLSQVMSGQ
jgi:molybdate/tungstate transport system substrate-binding protein